MARRTMAWTVIAVALGAGASAAPASARPLGALTQLSGKAGCVSASGTGGCGRARGLATPAGAGQQFLPMGQFVAVSPDGRNVYAAGDGVAVFSRDSRTGRVTQLRGKAGCVRRTAQDGCATGRGLDVAPRALGLSRDGRSVYVTSGDTVLVFARNRESGALTQLSGESGCISGTVKAGCVLVRGVRFGLGPVVVTSDGRNLYSVSGAAVLAFTRNRTTGALSQLEGDGGCIGGAGLAGCGVGRLIESPTSLAASPGGGSLYVVDPNTSEGGDPSGVAVFGRERDTGALSQRPGDQGCVSAYRNEPACGVARELELPASVVVSPDGRSVYVPGEADQDIAGDLTVFTRDPRTGALTQPPGKRGCLSLTHSSCAPLRAIFYPQSLAVSPDGRSAYLGGRSDPFTGRSGELPGAVEVMARDRDGTLTRLAGTAGCVRRSGGEGCKKARALKDAATVAVSPDGRHVYVASRLSAAVAVFARTSR